MPNTDLTVMNITEEVTTALGSSSVEVELTERDLERCIRQAIRVYNRHRPFRGAASLAVTSAVKKYGPIDTLHPGFQGIVQVDFRTTQHEFGDPFESVHMRDRTGLSVLGDTWGEFDQKAQYLESSRRIAGAEPEWQQFWEKHPTTGEEHCYLYVDVSTIPVEMAYRYTAHCTPDNEDLTGMQHIPEGDVDWVLDYVLAQAKMIVGRVRKKYGGIVTPDGSTQEVDGTEMLEEGKEEKVALEEALKKRRRPLPPVFG